MKSLLIFFISFWLTLGTTAHTEDEDAILILNKSGDTAWQINAETGERTAEYQTEKAPHEVAVSPDQNRAVITNYGAETPGNSLTIINLKEQKVAKTISLGEYERPHGVEWFSDGERAIITAEAQHSVITIDIDSEEILSVIETGQEVSHMVTLSSDEQTAYVTNLGSGSVSVLDLASEKVIETIKTGAGTEGVTTVPGNNEVWITNRSANTLSIIDESNYQIIETLESSEFPIRAEASPKGDLIAVSNAQSSEVSVFDVDERRQIHKISTVEEGEQGMPIGITFSASGDRLYAANSESDQIAVINTQNWQVISQFKTGSTPDGIAYISSESN